MYLWLSHRTHTWRAIFPSVDWCIPREPLLQRPVPVWSESCVCVDRYSVLGGAPETGLLHGDYGDYTAQGHRIDVIIANL